MCYEVSSTTAQEKESRSATRSRKKVSKVIVVLGLESISCMGNHDPPRAAPLSYTGSKMSEDPPSAALAGYTGLKLGETVGLNTFASDTGSL